ncbi:DUF1648 domain-containing protein [Rhodococcus aetherivorans]
MTDDPGTDRRPTGRILLSSTAAPLAVAAAGALVLRSWHAQLPNPIATHWNLDGTADGFAGLPATIALLLGFGVLFAALGFGLARVADTDPALTRAVAATVTGTVAFVTALIVLVTGSQRGLADAAAASPPGASLLAALGIGVALGAVAAAAVPRWSRGPASPRPPMHREFPSAQTNSSRGPDRWPPATSQRSCSSRRSVSSPPSACSHACGSCWAWPCCSPCWSR